MSDIGFSNNSMDPGYYQMPDNILNIPENAKIGPLLHSEKVKKSKMPETFLSGIFDVSEKEGLEPIIRGNAVLYRVPNDNDIPNYYYSGEYFEKVVEAAHLYFLLWFLAVYVIVYYLFGFFFNLNDKKDLEKTYTSISGGITMMSKTLNGTFDFIMFLSLILYFVYLYLTLEQSKRDNIILFLWEWSWHWFEDTANFFGVLLFTFCFYLLVYLLRLPMSIEIHSYFVYFIDSKIWSFIAFFFLIYIFKYVLGIDIPAFFLGKDFLTDLWGPRDDHVHTVPVDTRGNTTTSGNTVASSKKPQNEVFNISNNLYTYEDAQSVCSVYGARLANYNEMEDAYNKGGEWCNYGWSDGQMAFFPTQKATWDKLQADPRNKNKCGRPGVNGGYIANPYTRFGVNCFGKRPTPKDVDIEKMKVGVLPAKTPDEIAANRKVEFWKANQDKLLQINSFNKTNWSEF